MFDTTNYRKPHAFDPVHDGADECECGLTSDAGIHATTSNHYQPQSTTEDTPVNVHALTVLVCQDCIDLKGVMCNNAECVFCRRTMVEVQKLLDAMLLCPIVDGKRLILVGDAVTNEDSWPSPASAAPVVDGISWSALLAVLERLKSKTRNPDAEWYHGWNAAIQCLINDIHARSTAAATAAPQLHWPFAAKHQNCAECDKEYELPPAAAPVEQADEEGKD